MWSTNRLLLFISTILNSLLLLCIPTTPTLASSEIFNDPQGFQGIKWGTPLHTLAYLYLTDSDDRIQVYEFKEDPFQFANTQVESFRLLTIDDKFVRVMIRYHGEDTHDGIMKYLSNRYGEVKRPPGSMVRGLNQENTWRGNETEASLNYREHGSRGFLMIQSRILAPLFLELSSDHSH